MAEQSGKIPDRLILASSSKYRRRLLERLCIPFSTESPDVDESPRSTESGMQMALRLAVDKAKACVPTVERDPLYIGSDQVAACDNRLLGKPGDSERAAEQLSFCAGKHVVFFTAVALWRPASAQLQTDVVATEVALRQLTPAEIQRYIAQDQPLDCAGSFKWESLGISLFRKIATDDPTALEGLPLMRLSQLLREHGYALP